jgi:hypothetical protein
MGTGCMRVKEQTSKSTSEWPIVQQSGKGKEREKNKMLLEKQEECFCAHHIALYVQKRIYKKRQRKKRK